MLNDVRRALAHSRGQVVLIGGDAGIGKSRLLAQFVRASTEGRVRNVATAECLESAQRPFGPIRDWVAALSAKVRSVSLPAETLRALAHLNPHVLDGRETPSEGLVEKADVFAAVAAFLKAVATERATILCAEDIHWADPSTLEILAFLASRVAGTRLMIVATYRADELATNELLASTLARMERETTVRSLRLPALTAGEIDELMAGALDGHVTPAPDVVREIAKQSEGNPFFAEELLKGAIERPGTEAIAGLPLSIRSGILERLGGLSEAEREVVAGAAVLGYRFDPDVLALTMGRPVDDVLPALRRARNLNIVLEEDAPNGSFRFRHALTRQTIYTDMLQFDARRMHDRILGTLEALDDPSPHLDQLAYHAWVARDARKTLAYNERAGEVALEMSGVPEARTYFERALSVASESADEARLLERVGHVAQLQGRSSDALDAFEAALALRRGRGEYDLGADLVRAIVAERNNISDRDAMALGEAYLAENDRRLGNESRNALLALMARLASARYDFAGVEEYLARIVAPETLQPRARQNCLIAEMELRLFLGEGAKWHAVAQQLNDLVAEMPVFNAGIVLYTVAQGGIAFGSNQLVERAFERAARVEERWDFGALGAFGAAVQALYWLQRGRLGIARRFLERAIERQDVYIAQATVAPVGPQLALALGDEALGERSINEVVSRDLRTGFISPDEAPALVALAAWAAAHGRPDQARSDARRALSAISRPVPSSGIVLAIAAELLSEAELDAASALYDPSSVGKDDAVGRANIALGRAICARRFGTAADATALGHEAAATFRNLGWPLLEARALEAAGDTQDAIELFERCGAVAEVRRLTPGDARTSRDVLSPRERAVALLVAEGLSNAAIAERLAVSGKTVEKYVSSLFAKLGVRSRAQIASAFAREEVVASPRAGGIAVR